MSAAQLLPRVWTGAVSPWQPRQQGDVMHFNPNLDLSLNIINSVFKHN